MSTMDICIQLCCLVFWMAVSLSGFMAIPMAESMLHTRRLHVFLSSLFFGALSLCVILTLALIGIEALPDAKAIAVVFIISVAVFKAMDIIYIHMSKDKNVLGG